MSRFWRNFFWKLPMEAKEKLLFIQKFAEIFAIRHIWEIFATMVKEYVRYLQNYIDSDLVTFFNTSKVKKGLGLWDKTQFLWGSGNPKIL